MKKFYHAVAGLYFCLMNSKSDNNIKWYLKVLRQYVDFRSRTGRKEFWLFSLIHPLVIGTLLVIDELINFRHDSGIGLISSIYTVATFIPSTHVRRLHDTGRSGAWILLHFVPVVGSTVLFIFYCLKTLPHDNQWGKYIQH
jgi:uncharacterized membrane protein YhaH (DUF805 family)